MKLRRILCAAIAGGVLAGCATEVHHVRLDPARLTQGAPIARVACPYRLTSVDDDRPAGDRAGGLAQHMFVLEDVAGIVRGQLLDAGLSESAGTPVRLRVLQFYLAQNTVTKIPVAVYELRIGDGKPMVIRSQLASMNWWGSEREGYRAYAAALADSVRQVVARLDAACAAPAVSAPGIPRPR